MKQPWIHKAKTDGLFILSPTFIILAIVFLCQDLLRDLQENYSFLTWLFFVVFIDVAHVYATLFKTYLVPQVFQKQKKLLILLPLICFAIGMILFMMGSRVFWVVLAYVAVFHFIRQQYGFMRLYSRFETKTVLSVFMDNLVIYTATVYPMIYWFMSTPRNFTWFMPNEFFIYRNDMLLHGLGYLYYAVIISYIVKVIWQYYKTAYFNIPKNAIIAGTILSWYFGIVYYNNDLVFTMLNVVSHGIPYIGLIYLKEIKQGKLSSYRFFNFLTTYKGAFLYVGILLLLAFSEEYFWEIMVWNEQFDTGIAGIFINWHFILVPLLVVPQFTHYILDGFIWKTKQ